MRFYPQSSGSGNSASSKDLQDETAAREAADAALDTKIDENAVKAADDLAAEATARAEEIAAEKAAREAAVAELEVQIAAADEINGEVDNFSALPAAADHSGEVFKVKKSSGIWGFGRKSKGFYQSDGTNWAILSDYDEIKSQIQANEEALGEKASKASVDALEDRVDDLAENGVSSSGESAEEAEAESAVDPYASYADYESPQDYDPYKSYEEQNAAAAA